MPGLKIALLVPDGAADEPLEQLGGKTPLEAAGIPNMDRIVSLGTTGTLRNVPPDMAPGSDVANLSLLGYDPCEYYGGRGPIEAANLGITIPEGWSAFRCNLVSTDGERMLDYSAGHIGQRDAGEIIDALKKELGDDDVRFYQGKSYRNIVLLEGVYDELECVPPHDITGEPLAGNLPSGEGADVVTGLMMRSREVLGSLPVNKKRAAAGLPEVTMIWLWGQGSAMDLEPFETRYGVRGGVISAVDLVNGLGRLVGLEPVKVPGITGFLDTNYAGKGQAAVDVLRDDDFIFVHVEAPDEASHMGSPEEKVNALERFDELVVGPVLEFLEEYGAYRILVCPDHPTFISTRTHDGSPVPYGVCGAGIEREGFESFSERDAEKGGPHFDPGWMMMGHLTGREPWA